MLVILRLGLVWEIAIWNGWFAGDRRLDGQLGNWRAFSSERASRGTDGPATERQKDD